MVENLPNLPPVQGRQVFDTESRRSPKEENGNPLQFSCLGNIMGRGTWWATVHGVAKELDAT